ncbi:MAG: isoprenyl transferase [Actinobacteria bacterium]|nr:isoprenyl transferase [Actinomycetota bacterium]
MFNEIKSVIRAPLEAVYEKRLARRLHKFPTPRHIGVILDGNRRWAANQGGPTSRGHRVGASKISQFLEWCEEQDVEVVTLWLLSTDNLRRSESELIPLLGIIEQTAVDLANDGRWKLQAVGALDGLPEKIQLALKNAEALTSSNKTMQVNLAVGYGGRQEVVDAVSSYIREEGAKGNTPEAIAAMIDAEAIENHLYTKGQPDPDLVIRTSGEQRLSGFLLWQSAHSEFWFCEAYWPDFRRIDFLRAIRDYGIRQRRYGG